MRYETRTEVVEAARAGEEGPEICASVQKELCSLTHGRVCGDPISHVPGEHIVFGISQATCSWAEENKLKHANKTTSYAPVPLEIILSTVNL